MTSQLVIFRAFFLFFCPTNSKSENKIPVNQLIKKIGPKLSTEDSNVIVSRLTRFYYKVIVISELTSMVYCMLYLFMFYQF